MKKFKVVEIAYLHQGLCMREGSFMHENEDATFVEHKHGLKKLEELLNSGWSIVDVRYASLTNMAIFLYIMESPE